MPLSLPRNPVTEHAITSETIWAIGANVKAELEAGTLFRSLQPMVNRLALDLIQRYPEVAEQEPEAIGKMAKAYVLAFAAASLDFTGAIQPAVLK